MSHCTISNYSVIIRHQLFIWLCVIASPLSSLAIADEPGVMKAESDNRPVMLILGDSLSAGTGIRVESGWVNLLDKRLVAEGYQYRIVNASLNGLPTPGGLSRLPGLLDEHKPALLVLELGANDGLRGFPIDVMKKNLISMVRLGKKSGATVLLVGVQIPLNYGPQYTDSFEKTFREVSTAEKVALAPSLLGTVPLDPNMMQADGLHPNALAQPFILDNVWPHLSPLLKK